jgi:Zn-dependent protease
MTPTRPGSIRLFRFAGIDLFVHWSWLLVAVFEIRNRADRYTSLTWNVLEYLTLFVVVMLHEFGHALACRQVGGQANQIMLWPLGGVAFVNPPPRPTATLWSIAAGPLVNVGLLLLALGASAGGRAIGGSALNPNAVGFLHDLAFINIGLLMFNLLPVYPLDGGQILRALLWFVLGRTRSLLVASALGLVGVAALFGLALVRGSVWLAILAVFVSMSCWRGLRMARALSRQNKLPRHTGFACPSCKTPPPMAKLWKCSRCLFVFDTFASRAVCPNCSLACETTACPACGFSHPLAAWEAGALREGARVADASVGTPAS